MSAGTPYPPAGASAPAATPEGLEYHLLQQGGKRGVWRPLLGTMAMGVGTFAASGLAWQLVFGLFYAATGRPVVASMERLIDFDRVSPAGLAYVNLTLATAIPLAFLVTWALHGLRPRWLASVRPRMRWGYFLMCLGLASIALFAALLVGALLPVPVEEGAVGTDLNPWTTKVRDFLLVIALLTPLQAAGEEYLFRGYLTQAFGGLAAGFGQVAARVVAVVVPAVLFALAHGLGQDVPIFFDRLAFGLVAGVLVIVTGGLEAGIAMHVLNNFVAFGLALAFTDIETALNPTDGSWWTVPTTLTQSLVYLALAWGVARVMGLRNRCDPAVLAAR